MTPHTVHRGGSCVLAAALLTGCTHQAPTEAMPAAPANVQDAQTHLEDPVLDRARAAAMAFSSQLRARLQSAMADGGPIAAVAVCHSEAPSIAATVMAEHGVLLGRIALPGRNRNPAQSAGGWQLAMLVAFQQAVDNSAAGGELVSVARDDLPEGIALRMMRGIITEPGCLACHGSELSPDVQDAIAQHYPDDGATGFSVGDLRGALWVEVPASPSDAAGGLRDGAMTR